MAGRSPARFLAPLALVAFALALFMIVSNGSKDDVGSKGAQGTAERVKATATPKSSGKKKSKRRTYVIKSGDTPSGIAAKTGVPLTQILQLNPDLDPQALTPGTKVKLRR